MEHGLQVEEELRRVRPVCARKLLVPETEEGNQMLDRTLLDTSERFRKCVNPDFSLFFCYSLFFLGCTESSLVHEGFL